MKQIRKSLFETNSSSTHVITLDIQSVNNIVEDVKLKCPNIFELDFEYTGLKAQRVSLLFAAIFSNLMNIEPIDYGCDSPSSFEEVQDEIIKLQDEDDSYVKEAVDKYIGIKRDEFVKSDICSYICKCVSDMGYKIDLDDIFGKEYTNGEGERSFHIKGLDKILKWIEWNPKNDPIVSYSNVKQFINDPTLIKYENYIEEWENY